MADTPDQTENPEVVTPSVDNAGPLNELRARLPNVIYGIRHAHAKGAYNNLTIEETHRLFTDVIVMNSLVGIPDDPPV